MQTTRGRDRLTKVKRKSKVSKIKLDNQSNFRLFCSLDATGMESKRRESHIHTSDNEDEKEEQNKMELYAYSSLEWLR